jgi:hypothetical protein
MRRQAKLLLADFGAALPDQFMDSWHLKYPPFKPELLDKLKSLCK